PWCSRCCSACPTSASSPGRGGARACSRWRGARWRPGQTTPVPARPAPGPPAARPPDRMRVLIDILHPAHVHFFRNFHAEMTSRGHQVCITARDKDRSVELLTAFGLPYRQISAQKAGAGLAVEMAQRTPRLIKIMRSFKPDVMTGIMGPSIAVAGALRLPRVPAVVFYDTEFAVQTNRVVYPLAYSVCTPDCYQGQVPGRHPQYAGYHELAYLH